MLVLGVLGGRRRGVRLGRFRKSYDELFLTVLGSVS